MDFSEALTNLKAGVRMRRTGWNGKGMFVGSQYPDGESKMTLPYLYLRTVRGELVPWVASHTDLLSEDWEVIFDDR